MGWTYEGALNNRYIVNPAQRLASMAIKISTRCIKMTRVLRLRDEWKGAEGRGASSQHETCTKSGRKGWDSPVPCWSQLQLVFAIAEVGSGQGKHRNIPMRRRKRGLFPGRSDFKAFFHSSRTG